MTNALHRSLSLEQSIQEDQYVFPYHYLSLHDEIYRRFIHRHYISLLDLVREYADVKHGESVLDAGCGDGRFCYEIRNSNAKVVGIDYSERAISFARAFAPECEFRVADLTTCNAGTFDKVVSIEVIEHIPPAFVKTFVRSMVMCARPGGCITVSVPSSNLPVSRKHYQHFMPNDLVEIFRPWCDVVTMMGHIQASYWHPFMRNVRRIGMMWPFRHRLPFAQKYMGRVERTFDERRLTSADKGVNIVAVLRRRPGT